MKKKLKAKRKQPKPKRGKGTVPLKKRGDMSPRPVTVPEPPVEQPLPRFFEVVPEPKGKETNWQRASRRDINEQERKQPVPDALPWHKFLREATPAEIAARLREANLTAAPEAKQEAQLDGLADPVGEFFREKADKQDVVVGRTIDLEAERGGWLDDAVARQERGAWTKRDAIDMAKVVKVLRPKRKPGREGLDPKTFQRIHLLAFFTLHKPELKGHKLAHLIDPNMKSAEVSKLRDRYPKELADAIERLKPTKKPP